MTEGDKIVSNDVDVAETMNEFFGTVNDSLGINENSNNENASEGILDPVEKAVQNLRIIQAFLFFNKLPLMPLTRRLGI